MEKLKFEKAIEKLEKIVEELENGNLSLDDALNKYEEGIKLSKFCSKKLDEADKRVEILMKTSNGHFETEPFSITDEETAQKKERKKSRGKGKMGSKNDNPVDDEDLLFS